MELLRTNKDILNEKEILEIIKEYQENVVPELDRLWRYYTADNPTIIDKKRVSENNPDNRTVVSYGRKIVTTFTGYAYRPRYISYKISEGKEAYLEQLQATYDQNREHIKTSRDGRNTAIFGFGYEILFLGEKIAFGTKITRTAEPRFVTVDPRTLIVLYDTEIEPNIKIAIRFLKVNENLFTVEVMYPNRVETYEMKKEFLGKWKLTPGLVWGNYYGAVPVVAYYLGDDKIGIIKPVETEIDDLDLLISGGMDELERFANAYLLLIGMTLSGTDKKDPNSFQKALARLKKSRVFENLSSDAQVKFLTKNLPTDWIQFMYDSIRQQIHTQSHVPDLSSFSELSGIAVQRLMFDFENVVSTAESDFDVGLIRRIDLINVIYGLTGQIVEESKEIMITHKRNAPLNIEEFAKTSLTMKQAGYSSWAVVSVMPDDVIPDIDEELERQMKEQKKLFESVEAIKTDEPSEDEDDG